MPDILTEEEAVRHFASATLRLLKAIQVSETSRLLAEIRQLTKALPRVTAVQPVESSRSQALEESKPLLLNVSQAAKSLSVSKGTLFNLTAPRGPIPAVKMGARVCYAVKDLERAIETLKVKPSQSS